MAFTTPAFVPSTGLKDTSTFVTTPASETAARKQIQDVLDQALAAIQTLIDELEAETSGSSGGELVHTKAIAGVTGTTVGAQLADLKSQIDGVTAGSVSDESITTAKLAADAVTNAKLADDAVDTENIADDAITAALIDDGAVVEAALGTGAVTAGKIGTGAVTETKIGSAAVTEAKIGTSAVTETKIGALAVTEGKIATGAVTQAKLASTTYTTPNSLWTGTWNTGTITLDVSAYTVFMIVVEYGAYIATKTTESGVIKIEGGGPYSMASAGAIAYHAVEIGVSGTTLTLSKARYAIISNGSSPSVADSTMNIIAIYGIA